MSASRALPRPRSGRGRIPVAEIRETTLGVFERDLEGMYRLQCLQLDLLQSMRRELRALRKKSRKRVR